MEQCSKKWKNLRDQFIRELKREKETESPTSWKFFNNMTFLKEAVRVKK